MGRTATNRAHQFFKFNKRKNRSKCILCFKELTGNHGTNLARHVFRFHPEEFATQEIGEEKKTIECTSSKTSVIDCQKIKIVMDAKTLEDACVEMVTTNGNPFSIIEDSGFKKILDPLLVAINEKRRQKVTINEEKLKLLVTNKAENLRNSMINNFTGKLLSLKIDIATRLGRSFLGVNVQFVDMENEQIVLKTLALKEIFVNHSAANLKSIIDKVLESYKIKIEQIYSVTTDNGTNMLKIVQLMQESQDQSGEAETENDNAEECVNSFLSTSTQNDDDKSNKIVSDNGILDNIQTIYFQQNSILTGMRCAAHTLQLAVEDALKKNSYISELICKARSVTKVLRTPTYSMLLKRDKIRKPVIDVATQWLSTFEMLVSLLDIQEYVNDLDLTDKKLKLTDEEWNKIKDLHSSLLPAKITTEIFHSEQLILSELYGEWLRCVENTRKLNTKISKILVVEMVHRQETLFKNKVVLASVLLDPRFKVMLTDEQKSVAQEHLINLYFYVQKHFLRQTENADKLLLEPIVMLDVDVKKEDVDDPIEILLENLHQEKGRKDIPATDIRSKIDAFINSSYRIPRKSNVFSFWNSQRDAQPELAELAEIVLGMPATQVSVERLFSGLKYILSPLRSQLDEQILENVVFIRANNIIDLKYGNKDEDTLKEKIITRSTPKKSERKRKRVVKPPQSIKKKRSTGSSSSGLQTISPPKFSKSTCSKPSSLYLKSTENTPSTSTPSTQRYYVDELGYLVDFAEIADNVEMQFEDNTPFISEED